MPLAHITHDNIFDSNVKGFVLWAVCAKQWFRIHTFYLFCFVGSFMLFLFSPFFSRKYSVFLVIAPAYTSLTVATRDSIELHVGKISIVLRMCPHSSDPLELAMVYYRWSDKLFLIIFNGLFMKSATIDMVLMKIVHDGGLIVNNSGLIVVTISSRFRKIIIFIRNFAYVSAQFSIV